MSTNDHTKKSEELKDSELDAVAGGKAEYRREDTKPTNPDDSGADNDDGQVDKGTYGGSDDGGYDDGEVK